MAVRKKGLGRGLDSIIPNYYDQETVIKNNASVEEDNETKKGKRESTGKEKENTFGSGKNSSPKADSKKLGKETNEDTSNNGVRIVRISKIEPNKKQPRKNFDEDALQELAESIRQVGVIQPVVVQARGDFYEIIAGERRWRAARLAGLKEIPVVIKELTEKEILELSLIENIQREDLNAIEEAQAYQQLIEEFHLKQDELAERVSKSRAAITNTLRLLKLDEKVQEMLISDMISAGHARALLALEDPKQQIIMANRILDERLSVRETEKLIRQMLSPKPAKKEDPKKPDDATLLIYHDMEEKLRNAAGTKVTINYKNTQKGKLEIEYYSNEELERIYDLILSGSGH